MSVTVSPNVIFLKDITHKNILVTLTSPGIFMDGCSQDKDGFFFFKQLMYVHFSFKMKVYVVT